MKFTNNEIYQLANIFNNLFDSEIYIPAKANFFIQKNIKTIAAAAQEIEKSRLEIAQHYGELNEEQNQFIIPDDKIADANKELNDLFTIEQELDIKTFKIDDLGNGEFTPNQMQVLMIMISED